MPKTNCKDCAYVTCFAFATSVVVEKEDLAKCPHIDKKQLEKYSSELSEQHQSGKWVKKDLEADALQWAKERSASMNIEDLPDRLGGKIVEKDGTNYLELAFFNGKILIRKGEIINQKGEELNHWEQVFLYNHMSQGGSKVPTGKWKALEEIPNTISKTRSMKEHVENPITDKFKGKVNELVKISKTIGGEEINDENNSADTILLFKPLPRIPLMLLFWDEDLKDGFEAKVKVLFDETIVDHLDIESIMFLSERLRQLLCTNDQ